METLVLKNGTPEDIKLLLDISNKIGLQLEWVKKVSKRVNKKPIAKKAILELTDSRTPNTIKMQEIVEECREVREGHHEE